MVRLSCQGQALYKHWISVHHGELECIQHPYAIQTLDYHVSEWDVQSFSGIYISIIASIASGVTPQVVIYMPNQCSAGAGTLGGAGEAAAVFGRVWSGVCRPRVRAA